MPKKITETIRFIVGGDAFNSTSAKFRKMCKQAAKNNPRFAIIGGDIAYAAPFKQKTYKEDFQRWLNFFDHWMTDMRDKNGYLIPLLTTIGNHEVKGGFDSTPKEAPFYYTFFEKSTYDLVIGNYAHLIFLDSDHTQSIKGSQTKYLEHMLKKPKKIKHRFATYHVGAYPSTGSFDSSLRKDVRKYWVPLFEKYKVNACFENHDHAYKRTHTLRKGKPHPDGIVYFGDGSWGVNPRTPKKDRPYLANAQAEQQVLLVELLNDKRIFTAVNPKGKILDWYEQQVK